MSSVEKRVQALKETLATRFGYGRKEAKGIAIEVVTNLDRHVALQETMIKRVMENRKK